MDLPAGVAPIAKETEIDQHLLNDIRKCDLVVKLMKKVLLNYTSTWNRIKNLKNAFCSEHTRRSRPSIMHPSYWIALSGRTGPQGNQHSSRGFQTISRSTQSAHLILILVP